MLQTGIDAKSGYLSDQQIAAQMSVLNSAFSGVQVVFALAGVQRITNRPDWWCARRSWSVVIHHELCMSAPIMWSLH